MVKGRDYMDRRHISWIDNGAISDVEMEGGLVVEREGGWMVVLSLLSPTP